MVAYGKGIRSVLGDPGGRGKLYVQEKERAACDVVALKADFCREGCAVSRSVVDSSVKDGTELNAVFAIKDNTVDGVWIKLRSYTVHYYVSCRDLS